MICYNVESDTRLLCHKTLLNDNLIMVIYISVSAIVCNNVYRKQLACKV